MRFTFIHPEFLALLVLLPLAWAPALLGPRRLARVPFWVSLALRSVILLGLVLALAGTQVVRPLGATTTMFLLDGSDSVALSQRAQAEGFVEQALANMPTDDQAGIVVFGQRALVERAPSDDSTLGQIASQPGGGATDLESALQLGLAMLPGEGHRRLVVLSDGGQNTGDATAAARLAAERGVPVDVIQLNGRADGLDAQITRLELPAATRVGQQLRLRMTLESNTATSGRLTVSGPQGQTITSQDVELPQGTVDLELALPEPQQAFNRYTARIEVSGDARPENNAAEAYTFVGGRPLVLLVEGEAGAAQNLAASLKAASIETKVVAPAQLPVSIGELIAYDAIALIDVPQRAVAERTQSALAAYVHDLGRGLLMVGGPNSFGAGNWRDTPIETALPVSMDVPTRYALPPASIVVLIDISGSMAEEEGGRTKLQLAAEGAAQIATLMRDEDEITVIPFDSDAQGVIGPLPGSKRDDVIARLGRMEPGGGGIEIHDGLLAAENAVKQAKNPVRHIITITDGADTQQQEGALEIVQRLREAKVTLTSIAVGDGGDVPFLRDAVKAGGGRFFLTQRAAGIPAIMTDEAQVVIRSFIVEESFVPVQSANHPILRGIESVPELKGYVVTSQKSTAQVLLATPRGEPLLATWQYGLGHAAAWTSDMRGQWAVGWAQWSEFPRFGAQLMNWLLPAPSNRLLSVEPATVNGQLVLEARAQTVQGSPQPGLRVTGRLIRGNGEAIEVPLREVGPGRYRAAVVDAAPGAYLLQVLAENGQGQPVDAVTAGVVVPQSAEYRAAGANPGLLAAIARLTGGREQIAPTAAFDPSLNTPGAVSEIGFSLVLVALLLLPLDVAVRRLRMGALEHARGWESGVRGWGARMTRRQRDKKTEATSHTPQGTPQASQLSSKDNGQRTTNKSAELTRLREAQEQARKRARGEE